MVNLFKRRVSTNGTTLTKEDKERSRQLRKALKASTQNTIKYTSLFEDGLMHIADEEYSKTWSLGDTNYLTADESEKLDVIDYYVEALNGLDSENTYQLLIINRPVPSTMLSQITYNLEDDDRDVFRNEYNDMITSRFATDQNNFKVEKFITKVIVRKGTVTFVFYNGVEITKPFTNGPAGNQKGWMQKKEAAACQ